MCSHYQAERRRDLIKQRFGIKRLGTSARRVRLLDREPNDHNRVLSPATLSSLGTADRGRLQTLTRRA